MKQARLDRHHYASKWKVPDVDNFYDVSEVNALGQRYAVAIGPEKEALLLELIKKFHTYLMKYLNMIVRGHLAKFKNRPSTDSVAFLKFMIGKDTPVNRKSLHEAVKFLHLAFKQQDSNDIYDTLMMCLLKAIRKYDPFYTDKLRRLIGVISDTEKDQIVLAEDIAKQLDFDCSGLLRMLVSHDFLATQKANKKILGYQRLDAWPPPADKFGVDVIGFTYFVQKWFRYYLQSYIERATDELEAKSKGDPDIEGYALMQLEHRVSASPAGNYSDDDTADLLPHKDGNLRDANGLSWAVDVSAEREDLGHMDLDWVRATKDPLFRNLQPVERFILFQHFAKELTWEEIAKALQMTEKEVHDHYDQVMLYLRTRAAAKTEATPIKKRSRRKRNKSSPVTQVLGIQSCVQNF